MKDPDSSRWSAQPNLTSFGMGSALSGSGKAEVHNITEIHLPRTGTPTDNEIAAAQERLASMPVSRVPPYLTLPFGSRMPFAAQPNLFVGRERELLEIARLLRDSGSTCISPVAATGMGGIGKTMLAIEFAHRYGTYFPGGVFWLSCADPTVVGIEVAECLDKARHPYAATLSIADRAQHTLGQWQDSLPKLLIFDNCEDEALLDEWRPKTGACRVLVTSRRQHWSVSLGMQTVELDVLTQQESISLLCKHCNLLTPTDPDLGAIAIELGGLPLALELAGSYLAHFHAGTTTSSYLASLRAGNPLTHRSLQTGPLSATHHEQHVARTFGISYGQLGGNHPVNAVARIVLTTAAYFAPGEPIPNAWLFAALRGSDAAQIVEEQKILELVVDALHRLTEIGLLAEEAGEWRLHRLLGTFVLTVAPLSIAQYGVERALFQIASTVQPAQATSLHTHFRAVTDRALRRADESASDLAAEFGVYLAKETQFDLAHLYLETAVAIRERLLGTDSLKTALARHNFATVLIDEGKFAQARDLLTRASEILNRSEGSEHDSTLNSLTALGSTLLRLGELDEAFRLLTRTHTLRTHKWGLAHPETATSMNALANVLTHQGKLQEACDYYEQALAIFESAGTDYHFQVGMCHYNLGLLFRKMDRDDSACESYDRALSVLEGTGGTEHPQVAKTLNNLANIIRDRNDLAAAVPLLERSTSIFSRVYGPLHPDTMRSLKNLAGVLYQLGDIATARRWFDELGPIDPDALDLEDPDILDTAAGIAGVLYKLGGLVNARVLVERVLATRMRILGNDHLYTIESKNLLAAVLEALGQLQEARPIYEQVLAAREQLLGAESPATLMSRNNLANVLHKLGTREAAIELHLQTLDIRERVLGDRHLDVAVSLHNLALIWIEIGKQEEAIEFLERAQDIRQIELGLRHPEALHGLEILAHLLTTERRHEEATRLCQEWLKAIEGSSTGSDQSALAWVQEILLKVAQDSEIAGNPK